MHVASEELSDAASTSYYKIGDCLLTEIFRESHIQTSAINSVDRKSEFDDFEVYFQEYPLYCWWKYSPFVSKSKQNKGKDRTSVPSLAGNSFACVFGCTVQTINHYRSVNDSHCIRLLHILLRDHSQWSRPVTQVITNLYHIVSPKSKMGWFDETVWAAFSTAPKRNDPNSYELQSNYNTLVKTSSPKQKPSNLDQLGIKIYRRNISSFCYDESAWKSRPIFNCITQTQAQSCIDGIEPSSPMHAEIRISKKTNSAAWPTTYHSREFL